MIGSGLASATTIHSPHTSSSKKSETSKTTESLRLELLYVQVAPHAILTKQCDKKRGKCHGQLIMQGISPYLLTFSNGSPNVSGYILNARFIKQYHKTKTAAGLNSAFLSYSQQQLTQQVLSISNPVYEPAKLEMRYDVVFLKPSPEVKAVNDYNDVALFIDSICAICVGP